jgi:hypothetical protein
MPTHRRLGPLAAARVHLGVVDPKGLDLDDHMAVLGSGSGMSL